MVTGIFYPLTLQQYYFRLGIRARGAGGEAILPGAWGCSPRNKNLSFSWGVGGNE